MDILVDKTLIFLLCFIIMIGNFNGEWLIGCALISIIITLVFVVLEDDKYKTILSVFLIAILMLLENLIYFVPLFFYDVIKNKNRLLVYMFFIGTMVVFGDFDLKTDISILSAGGIAGWMSRQSEKKKMGERKLIENRDNSFELTEALKNKNKALVEKQEYEIYAATLSERNRIAREIHDNVGHMLSRSILQVGALLAIHKEENINKELIAVKETLDSAMNSIRESVHDLHNASIDLEVAVKEVIGGMKGYDIEFIYNVDGEIEDGIKHCFLTTVKEAMSNVHKHSNGNKVWININEHPAFYQCIIKDNGTKSNHHNPVPAAPGIGLENIQSRVESLSGSLLITNDHGYRLFIMIPKK